MRQVAQNFVQSSATITRADNALQYTAGDVVAGDGVVTALVFPQCTSGSTMGEGGLIRGLTMTSSDDDATQLDADLFLFNVPPNPTAADNLAFDPTDTEMLSCVAVIAIDGSADSHVGLPTGTGNQIAVIGGLALPFQCAKQDSSLYGVLVARNTYTPLAEEVIHIKLGIQQG